jgi:hypothetical protein
LKDIAFVLSITRMKYFWINNYKIEIRGINFESLQGRSDILMPLAPPSNDKQSLFCGKNGALDLKQIHPGAAGPAASGWIAGRNRWLTVR